jgi:nucleotide-binding universal stress UspA family protein
MYRTIVLAYDGAQASREAADQATAVAKMWGAKVHLLAVVGGEFGMALAETAVPADVLEREYEQEQRILEEEARQLRDAGLTVEAHLAAGSPAQEIGRLARRVGADLIVVGHREHGTIARWWSGSVGESLLAHAACSVLVAVRRVPASDASADR